MTVVVAIVITITITAIVTVTVTVTVTIGMRGLRIKLPYLTYSPFGRGDPADPEARSPLAPRSYSTYALP